MVMSFSQADHPLTHDNAHGRPENLDPRNNGPFLDDVRREQLKAYQESRMKATAAPETEETNDDDPE
jgi:hypothetical protein